MMRGRWAGGSAGFLVLAVMLASNCNDDEPTSPTRTAPAPTTRTGSAPTTITRARARPSFVFVLTDDLSWDLVRFMPNVRRMQREGLTFTNYFVTDSLCCPSRASIFTGRYPHNTGVLTNTPPSGGFERFTPALEHRTFASALQADGYRTALMGKYLNGYKPASLYQPSGWTVWAVAGEAYSGFDYSLAVNGRIARFGTDRRAYITDVLRDRGLSFIEDARRDRTPFLLEIATFAPHKPYTPAPRDSQRFPGLRAPRGAAFDARVTRPPRWLRGLPRLSQSQIELLDHDFRRRAQAVRAVDELVARVRRRLKRSGLAPSTYILFSSDNGYHLGQRRLLAGKETPYDSDVRVPLIVVGPGVPAGSVMDEIVENVDLAPTFLRLAAARADIRADGHPLVAALHGRIPRRSRRAALIEHKHRGPPLADDPDAQLHESGDPPSYDAIRTKRELYVEYSDGDREWYDLGSDPAELENRYGQLGAAKRARLHERLRRLTRCRGASCRRATSG
jgi:N-acetylglucosamine-6-sulfatase